MTRHIDIETGQIEAFERAAHEGSFTRAADELGLTQPSVSARIAALESILGCPLFERGGRALRLTSAGKIFLPYAERALAAITDGIQAVGRYTDGKAGNLTIATLDTPGSYMLPMPMAEFRRTYPAVDIRIQFRMPAQVIDSLFTGDAMLGLTGAPVWAKGLQVHGTFRQAVRAIVSPKHPLAQLPQPISVGDLYHYTLYRVTLNPNVTAVVESIAESARPGSGGAIIFLPALMVMGLLIEAQGVAFLPESFVQKHIDAGRLMYLQLADLPPMQDELLLLALEGRELEKPAQAFIHYVRQAWRHLLVD
jgi:DNA-binding transcriptional LysR family regulator